MFSAATFMHGSRAPPPAFFPCASMAFRVSDRTDTATPPSTTFVMVSGGKG
ncbi:MAG: hypothetical protein R2882_11665 [Gemmatimonadales bacterium]